MSVKRTAVSLDRRRQLADTAGVTLDGNPAKISGVYNDYATVWPIDRPEHGVDFSWAAVERIAGGHKNFQS